MRLAFALCLVPLAVFAEPRLTAAADVLTPNALDRPLAISTYATSWAGSYTAAGIGGRVRWQAFRHAGLELFGEALLVGTPTSLRHDYPIGFNLYTPIRLGSRLQLRPLLGMCAVLSFLEPLEVGAPRSDDVLLGVHTGLAADFALGRLASLFAEGQAVAWAGHDRTLARWTGAIGNDVRPFVVGQATLGVAVHFGPAW